MKNKKTLIIVIVVLVTMIDLSLHQNSSDMLMTTQVMLEVVRAFK